ncbi:MAG: NTP transferase domain-containing protein, partial [Caulobacteraceae bacterium]|nr:NTP transferase domain-containing protein [Caulobacter sp.]
IFLGDMPRIPAETPPALAAAWFARRAPAAAPMWEGRRGHPVLLGRELFAEASVLGGDRGAGALLDRLGPRLARVEADDVGVLFDVDTPGALDG